ncbi:MAG: phosphoribosyltransferase family protein, partial [Chloroflexota bacterium]
RHTKPQIHLGPEERRSNVAGAFTATPDRVQDRHILLIDDVYTTGATMAAAAEAIRSAGGRSVSGYCLARVT